MAKKKKADPKQPDPGLAAKAASIGELRLTHLLCSLGDSAAGGKPKEDLLQTMSVSTTRVAENAVMVTALYLLHEKNKKPEDDGFRIHANYGLIFRFEQMKSLDPAAVVDFCLKVGATTLWPYWRELVQSLTTRMGLPGLRVPLLHPKNVKVEQPAEGAGQPEKKEKPRKNRKSRVGSTN